VREIDEMKGHHEWDEVGWWGSGKKMRDRERGECEGKRLRKVTKGLGL
jgi:hypothetical protein